MKQDLARLNSIIRAAQGRGPQIEPQTQRELILFRIARGNGRPVPLPEIQQGEFGGFVSDPQARICELRKLYLIDCETHKVAAARHSTYTLRLNPDGTPSLKSEIFIPSTPAPNRPAMASAGSMVQWEMGLRR